MRKFALLGVVVCLGACAVAAEGTLPAPKKVGGPSVLEAIDARASAPQDGFPAGDLTQEDWGTLLWAATGHNRDGSKWTVPMAMGRPPYCKVYIAIQEGVFLYDWNNHSLVQISGEDRRAELPTQAFGQQAPAVMCIVADGDALAALPNPEPLSSEFAMVLGGSIAQNVYLAAQTLDVGARLVYSVDRDTAQRCLATAANDKVLFAILLGKYQ